MNLTHRAEHLAEVMDDPDCPPRALRRTLRRFDLVNVAVAAWPRVYLSHLRPVLERLERPARLLDIGCGGGDVLRRLVRRARRDGFDITGRGIDPDERAVAVAREQSSTGGVTFDVARSAHLVRSGERFDIVVSNHLLHHLDREGLNALLADSKTLAEGISVHSDISRGRLAYAAFSAGILPFSPGTLLRVDGLRSIRRSYTPAELAEALPDGWRVDRPSRFRLLAVSCTRGGRS